MARSFRVAAAVVILVLIGGLPRIDVGHLAMGPSSVRAAAATDAPAATEGDDPTISDVRAFEITTDSAKITWTVSRNATGQVEYGDSVEYGSVSELEPSFRWATHIQQLSGLEPGTTYHYRAISVDQEGREVISDDFQFETVALLTPAPGTSPMVATWGPSVNADSLNNSPVGGPFGSDVAFRFRATETSGLESIRIYLMGADQQGYGAGSGGTLRVSVQPDDGIESHHPTGDILASTVVENPPTDPGLEILFDDPGSLEQGSLYHLVFENVDANPSENYVSVNGLFMWDDLERRQPAFSNTDWANLVRRPGEPWSDDRGSGQGTISPIMALGYQNGVMAGLGYMEVWVGAAKPISGEQRAKQTLTVNDVDRLVSSVSVRLKRVRGDGPLKIAIRDREGERLEVGSIAAQEIAISEPAADGGSTWARMAFSEPLLLESGKHYEVVISTDRDTEYSVFVVREGSRYGYPPETFFVEGRALHNDGSGWEPFEPTWHGPIDEADLQLYFE